MSNVLIFCPAAANGTASKQTLAAITAALEIKNAHKAQNLIGLVLGDGAKATAETLAAYGLNKVLFSEAPSFSKYIAPQYAEALISVSRTNDCSILVTAASSTGKDLFPRVAALLEAGQASDIVAVNTDGTFRRPMYAGDVLAEVQIETAIKLITVRTSAFQPLAIQAAKGAVEQLSGLPDSKISGEVISYELSKAERPELAGASVVVSAGRALQSAENIEKYIFPLADVLGAAVGASRAAVDSGYAPNDWQVGQTGKIVAPELYIAIGISGAIQHLAGMKDSKTIVAINKDADAPIFELADYGLVGDLFEILPQLTAEIAKTKKA
jgi:electron transfer flavoprotein alpha subunit